VAHRTSTIAGLVLATAVIAAACSSTATAAPAASSGNAGGGAGASAAGGLGALSSLGLGGLGALAGGKDPSTMLTADAATSILGSPATAVPGLATPISASYSDAAGDTVTIFIEALPGSVTQALLSSALAQANADGSLVAISGLGDVAGKEVSDTSATVGFAKGGTLVILNADSSSTQKGSDLEPKLESLAQQIAGGL
jgi:hypothetical protein